MGLRELRLEQVRANGGRVLLGQRALEVADGGGSVVLVLQLDQTQVEVGFCVVGVYGERFVELSRNGWETFFGAFVGRRFILETVGDRVDSFHAPGRFCKNLLIDLAGLRVEAFSEQQLVRSLETIFHRSHLLL